MKVFKRKVLRGSDKKLKCMVAATCLVGMLAFGVCIANASVSRVRAAEALTEEYLQIEHEVVEPVEEVVEDVQVEFPEYNVHSIEEIITTLLENEMIDLEALRGPARGELTSQLKVVNDSEYVKTVNDYFELYSSPTLTEEDISHTVHIGDIRRSHNTEMNWVSFECMEGKILNTYAITEGIGHMNEEEMDVHNQIYRGRYMVAMGPAVVLQDAYSKDRFVTASEVGYGTFIDVEIKDEEGNLYYIPCVYADCKAHTWPNGYIQTGKALQSNGSIDYAKAHVDWSSVEFGVDLYDAEGVRRDKGLCSTYELSRFIVYTLDASIKE